MRLLTLFLLTGLSGLVLASRVEKPSPRAHLVCFQCPYVTRPQDCRLVTSKCHTCKIEQTGNYWKLGCGEHHCNGQECCRTNLCNGRLTCPSGQYPGAEDGTCISCGHCLGAAACDSDGHCPNGCEPGWHGIGCDQNEGVTATPPANLDCPPGRYGSDCMSFCSGRCYLGSVCDAVTGECPELNGVRCISGYQGLKCDQPCDAGRYGPNCVNACSKNCYNDTACYSDSGFCPILGAGMPRCKSGWEGSFCQLDCERGRWGQDCTNVCSAQCWDFSPCDVVSGNCELFLGKPRCASGWSGYNCDTPCPRGIYGEDCLYNCSGHCYHGAACDRITGFCPVTHGDPRCASGWRGETCEISCPHDRYGEDCVQVCSSHCREGGLCDGVTGFCPLLPGQPRCEDGWTGAKCDQICSGGESEACVQKCTNHCYSDNACDPNTGVCSPVGSNPRCKAGWFGERCDKPCPPGSHGVDCQQICTGHCYHGAACNPVDETCPQLNGRARCEPGWQGPKCDMHCAPHTFGADCSSLCTGECYNNTPCDTVTGACPSIPGQPRCKAGYHNPYCEQTCITGRYGADCLQVCSGNCINGSTCNREIGHCPIPESGPRCEAGFFGESCEWACNPGTHGEDCNQHCSGHCYQDVSCEPITGRCPAVEGVRKCEAGYHGDKCDIVCEGGTFGENCQQKCGMCSGSSCDPVTGVCPGGCQAGYSPPLCTSTTPRL